MALLPLGRSFSKAYRNRQPRKNRPEDEYECLLLRECCPIPRRPQAINLNQRLNRRNFDQGRRRQAGIPELREQIGCASVGVAMATAVRCVSAETFSALVLESRVSGPLRRRDPFWKTCRRLFLASYRELPLRRSFRAFPICL